MRSIRKPAKLKARLIAYGFQQIKSLDYDETFVLVVKWGTRRTIVALATHKGWEVSQLDVKTTFLNRELKEEVYMVQPKVFVHLGEEGKVCKLQKELYKLKQTLRVWQEKINTNLRGHGLKRSESDHNLYYQSEGGEMILLDVDDLLLIGSNHAKFQQLQKQLENVFEMSNLRKLNCYLRVEFTHVNFSIFMGKQLYVEEMLRKFNVQDYRPSQTPMTKGLHLVANMKTKEVDATKYYKMVGKLIYLTNSRLDISFVVGVVSRFMAKPQ